MRVVDAIAEILKREGVQFLSCFPTAPMIEAAASAGIRPLVCRQERVGVGIADGFSRVSNGRRIGVFAMQAGPAERKTLLPEWPRPFRTLFPSSCFLRDMHAMSSRLFPFSGRRAPTLQSPNGSKS